MPVVRTMNNFAYNDIRFLVEWFFFSAKPNFNNNSAGDAMKLRFE
jgi:hypothetical protein